MRGPLESSARPLEPPPADASASSAARPVDEQAEVAPIDSLLPADSPRLSGEDLAHARSLGEKLAAFPPILVNRRTMRVIDGMHRLRAAMLAGHTTIKVRYVDTTPQEAFLLAVKANIEHGLPLSLADREAAALRIIEWHPEWSDRAIAGHVGLAPNTVGEIRRRSSVQSVRLNARIGRDGRVRPLSTADARQRASEILSDRPDTSLREVARMSGLSLGTVYDVRERMRQGQSPVPERQCAGRRRAEPDCGSRLVSFRRRHPGVLTWAAIRPKLSEDPTVRYTESGRALLRWLDTRMPGEGEWRKILEAVPPHWVDVLAGAAHSCGDEWHEFARELDRRRQDMA